MTHSQITSFIWSVADLIRDTFKRGKALQVLQGDPVLLQLYKRIAYDRAFGKASLDFLFEGFWRRREEGASEV